MAAAAPSRFPNPFKWERAYDSGVQPFTLMELRILSIEGAIKEKENWADKIHQGHIVEKWHTECGVNGAIWDFVLAELRHEAVQSTDGISETGVPGVFWKRRVRASESYLEGIKELERRVPVDWHPGSNELVRDLVHPSLFCYVDGVTPILETPASSWEELVKSAAIAKPGVTMGTETATRSSRYMWLPSEFQVGPSGETKVESYINNLHPEEHAGLVENIASIFSDFVPLFNRCLASLLSPNVRRVSVDMYNLYDEFSGDEEDYDGQDEYQENRRIRPLPTPTFVPRAAIEPFNLEGRRLQVITKIASIHLTPDKPHYDGGSWHVEGMEAENIVSSGIYYFDEDNISESRLHFRVCVSSPDYEQSDDNGVNEVYGMVNEGPMNQPLGSVPSAPGTMLVFPNILQHRLAPFDLADPSRPGFRKILVFFLVDPEHRILSTERVPPQRSDWGGKMTMEEAERHRAELMDERGTVIERNNEQVYEREFSLCEH